MKRFFYWFLRKELSIAASVYKFYGINSIADKMNNKITALDNDIKQGKTPQFLNSFNIILMLTLITGIFLFRKKIFSFIKKFIRIIKNKIKL